MSDRFEVLKCEEREGLRASTVFFPNGSRAVACGWELPGVLTAEALRMWRETMP